MNNVKQLYFGIVFCTSLCTCGIEEVSLEPPEPTHVLAVGETKTVELRYLRFDVDNFEQTMSIQDLRAIPQEVLEDVWLIDFDFSTTIAVVLQRLRELPEVEAQKLSQATQNMRQLLLMTPDNANLAGTKLEAAIALAAETNIPPKRVLANLLATELDEIVISPEIVSDVILRRLVASHPNAKFRKGPVDNEHPDGLYSVTPGSIPLSLADIAANFTTLPIRFGPAPLNAKDPQSIVHPGFIKSAKGISVLEDNFQMSVRANLNALPFKGIDLTSAEEANINSVDSQIQTMFNFEDPTSLSIVGLADELVIDELTMEIFENNQFIVGGSDITPPQKGNSSAWDLFDWELERLILEMAQLKALGNPAIQVSAIAAHCDNYLLGTDTLMFAACIGIDEKQNATQPGWTILKTFADIGEPPPPAYLWDHLLEVVQVRLHDGGLAEGNGDVEFTLRDIRIPMDHEHMLRQIRQNLAEDPRLLINVARRFNDNSFGDADFYYVQVSMQTDPSLAGDYLYFVTETDIRQNNDGTPVRNYTYDHPGFFRDEQLSEKISSQKPIDYDTTHEKIKIMPNDVFFMEDDAGLRFRIEVGEKPSEHRISLNITRIS